MATLRSLAAGAPGIGRPLSQRAVVALTVLTALLAGAALGFSEVAAPTFAAVGVGGAALAFVGLRQPAFFLLALLFLRAVLDNFSNVAIGSPSLNPAGALAIAVIALALGLPLSSRRIVLPAASASLAAVTAITAGGALLAIYNFGGTLGLDPLAEAVRIGALLAFYLLAANVLRSAEHIRTMMVVIGVSGVIPAVWGLFELVSGPAPDSEGLARISGPFNGPNPLGFYLAISALTLIGTPSTWLTLRTRMVLLAPTLAALLPTYSRVGYLTFVIGLLLLEGRRRPRMVVGIVAAFAVAVALVPAVRDRVFPQPDPSSGQESYESYSWRTQNWVGLLDKWTAEPVAGFGTSTAVVVNPRRPAVQRLDDAGGYEAHNMIVRILVEGGVVLLAAYLWAIVSLARIMWRLQRERWALNPVVRLVAVLWAVFLMVGLGTDDPVQQTAVMFVLVGFTGALEGAQIRRQVARRSQRTTVPRTPSALSVRPTS